MKKKLLFLFSMMALLFAPFTLWAQEPEPDTEYEAALAAIGDGGNYFISTDVGGTKYYITAAGKLTSVRADGCIFTLSKVEGGAFRTAGYYIDGGGTRFTNAPLSNSQAVLNVANYSTTSNNRADWEAQVLFRNEDGKYAIRATNAAYGETSWADAGRVFFSWKVEDVAIPQYTYDQVYLWELEATSPITVTYKLVESDGVTEVSSVAQKQEANSEVNIPSSLVNNFIYDYAASGTVGGEDCVITVTRTFKSGVVHALTDLSNAKAYTIRCDRGAFLTKDGHLASTAHGSLKAAEATNFAIINFEDKYYLFSVADGKFVLKDGALADEVDDTEDAVIMDAKTDPYFQYYFKINGTNNGLNTNGNDPYGYVINTWMAADAGNQYYMIEAADFDASSALATLQDCLHPVVYTITCAEAENGTVVANKEETRAGKTVKLTVTPEVGFELDALTVKAGDVEVAVTEDFTFVMPAGAVTVTATFKQFEGIPDGKYFVLNNASGLYWGAGNSWGTQASLLPHPEYVTFLVNENATYKLESQVNNGGTQYYFNGDFMDNGNPVELTLTKQLDGTFTIRTGSNYFGYDGSTTVLGKNLAADSENALWTIIPYDEAKANLANATIDQPIDATLLIEDHDFGRNNRNVGKWIVSEDCTNKNLSGGNNTNNCAESYHSVFTISQALTEVPNGVYALTAQGFYRQDGEDNEHLPVFFANDETAAFPLKTGTENSMSDASGSFSAGQYTINPIWVKVTDGTLNIGVKLAGNTALWCIWDNFVLTYYGDVDIADAKAAGTMADYAEVVDEYMEATVAEALKGAKATFDADKSDANLSALAEAVAVAKASAEAYAGAKVKLAAMKGLIDKTNFYTEEAYAAYYGDAKAKYDAATLTTAEANALQDPSVVTGWHAAITVDNFLLSVWDTNPDFEDAPYYINTWSVEGENDGTEFKVPFFEYWTEDANSLAEKTLTATIEGLEAGKTAVVNVWVRVRAKNEVAAADAKGITLQVNDGEAVDVTEGETNGQFNLAKYTAKGVIGEDGKLVVKFNVAADNNISWLSFKDAQFQAVDDEEVPYVMALAAIEDGATYSITTMVGETKYYLTDGGELTSDIDKAGLFAFNKVKGEAYEYGFKLYEKCFTNPDLSGDEAVLNSGHIRNNTQSTPRDTWEAQVFFLKDGKYAVRATNAPGGDSSWALVAKAFWTVNEGADGPVAEYSFDVNYVWELEKVTTVKVTYALYDAGSEEPVKSVVVTQKMNSEVSIPSAYTSVAFYDYVAEGTIGTEDCTIKVTRTYKAGLIFSLDDLSNTKAYTITCDRGAMLTNGETIASTASSDYASADPGKFAIISYEDNYYLYSVADKKFVTNSGTLSDVPVNGAADAIKMDPKTAPYFFWYFTVAEGTNYGVNTNGSGNLGGIVINDWMTADPGNQYYMIEAADFDPTAALAMLEKGAYLVPLQEALAANEPNPVLAGAGLFQKPQGAYDTYKQIYDAQKLVAENEASTIAELIDAKAALDDAIADYAAVEVNKPIAGELYMFQHKSSGGYMGFNDAGNLFVLDDPDAFVWSEVEGGYNLNNGAVFIAVDGNTLLGNAAEGVLINATPVATTEDGQLFYNIFTTTTDGKVRAITGSTAGKKATLLTTPSEKSQWTIVKYEPKTTIDIAVNVERYPGMGYTVTEASVDFAEAKKFLGVEDLTTDMLSIVNPEGDEITDYAMYDGWFNKDGVAKTWAALNAETEAADKVGINVKFFEAIPDGKFTICDMNGADEIGKAYTVKWALTANEKKAIFAITVTFVEKPAPVVTNISEVTIAETTTIEVKSELEKCYEGMTADVDVAAILNKLGAASLDDLLGIYAVASDGSLDDNYKVGTTDGWRNADGDWQGWGDAAYFYVKANFALESAQLYEIGGMQGKNTAADWENPATYTATYVFVNKDLQAVVLKVSLKYEVPVGIRDMQLDGKAEIYDLNGRKVSKIQRGGIYIVNGKRVAVK